jgi:Spy/CpxP family protein refolding chaperone
MRSTKILASLVVVTVLGMGLAPAARADDANAKPKPGQWLQNLTPAQRAQLKARILEKLKGLTPEQRQKLLERLKKRRAAQGK